MNTTRKRGKNKEKQKKQKTKKQQLREIYFSRVK